MEKSDMEYSLSKRKGSRELCGWHEQLTVGASKMRKLSDASISVGWLKSILTD